MLWKPRRGAVVSAEEFVAAQALFIAVNNDAMWNPWIRDERQVDIDQAAEIMSQWQRAEPGHRRLTLKQWKAQQARREREQEQQRARDDARREQDKARYSEEQALARLRLIEVRSRLDYARDELAGLRKRTRFPAMDPTRRVKEAARIEEEIERLSEHVEQLGPIVRDPEDVVDERGWLPSDRREDMWWCYRFNRERRVRELKQEMPKLDAALNATTDRAQRREHKQQLANATRELDRLVAEGPFTAEEMCSECATPMAHHGWVWPPGRPCPAWPGWAARICEARQMLETFTNRHAEEAALPPKPQPQLLAVVPSGLPIADVIAKLTELQQQFPDAEVRRGRANRWELWGLADPKTIA